MSADGLDLFLAEMSEQGVLDSEGFFTIAGDRALQKLAVYQLPREAAWVLKVIQAGVHSRASCIRVKQSGRSLQMELHRAHLGSLRQMIEIWTQNSGLATPAQNELAVALRTVCFASQRPAVLAHHDPREGVSAVIWDGEKLSPVQSASDLVRRNIPSSWVPAGCWAVRVYSQEGRRIRTDEFDEISRYAITCPVPLEVDGRNLNHNGSDWP